MEKKKKDKLNQFLQHGEIVILDELDTLNEKLDEISPSLEALSKIDVDALEQLKGDTGDQGPQGPKGDRGYSPVKGVDYFTEEELRNILDYCVKLATPVKGVDYRDGIDGKEGPAGKDGTLLEPEQIAEKLNTLKGALNADLINGYFTKEDIIQEIRDKKLLSYENIANMPAKGALDQRWHGGGKSRFLQLIDTPNSYAGQAGKTLIVNPAEDALIFGTAQGDGVTQIVAGTNVVISPTGGTGVVTISTDGGVSQIVAGTNITISPVGGTGTVTINNSINPALYVPYTGANQSVNLGTHSIILDTVELNTTYAKTGVEGTGTLFWDAEEHTGSLKLENDVVLQLGQEQHVYGKNISGTTIFNGQAVSITSDSGSYVALNKTDITSGTSVFAFAGIATQNILSNASGYITTMGLVHDLDTTAWNEGDVLYVGTPAGTITNAQPTLPEYIIRVGEVVYKNKNHGEIFVKSAIIPKLGDLSNVDGVAPSITGQFYAYDANAQVFDITQLTAGTNVVVLGGTGTITVSAPNAVIGPSSSGTDTIALFNGTTGKLIKDSGVQISNDATLAADSANLVPTQQATKTYVDGLIAGANALVYKGAIDCSTNPDYPAADAGWLYLVSVAGKIGGASGVAVEPGDMLICTTDNTPSGNQATVGSYWNIIQKNIDGYVLGPSSATNSNVAFFDGTTGKLIKDMGITLTGTNTGDQNVTAGTSIAVAVSGSTFKVSSTLVAGSDYLAIATTATNTWVLTSNGSSWVAAAPPSGTSGAGNAYAWFIA